MNCTEVRPLLSSYIDGEATPEERVRVEHHISRCEDCHQALAEYRAIGSNIRAMPVPLAPAGLRRDVWRAIEAREGGRRITGPTSAPPKAQILPFPRPQGKPSVAAVITSIGNGWARALPAALLIGGLMLVMAVILLRGTIATAAAELVERDQIYDYTKPVHVKFNKQVLGTDALENTSVRLMESTTSSTSSTPYTVTVSKSWSPTGNTGELTLTPDGRWTPGATYEIFINCPLIGLIVGGGSMDNEPLRLYFTAAAYTPTPTNTATITPTPTETPVPPTTTPEPTALAGETAVVPAPTRPASTAVVASPTRVRPSPTAKSNPTGTRVAITPSVPPTVEPTRAIPPTLTTQPSATATVVSPSATATATVRRITPTATSTSTPRVSPTATPPCSLMPVRGFGQVWQRDRGVRDRVGCAAAPEGAVTPTAYQRFEGGFMFWRGDTRTIYVFIGNPTDSYGVWRQYADTWQEGDPLPVRTPPAKLHVPVRGFGKVWHENESVQAALGWAVEPETNTDAVWQRFDRGNALWTADRTIRFLYSDGIYARFDDTFVPDPESEDDSPAEE